MDKVDWGTLKGGGDCLEHYHNSDRFPPRDTLLWLQSLEVVVQAGTADYTITGKEDIVVIEGGHDVYLPPAKNGRHYRIVLLGGSGSVTVYPDGSETIMGSATHSLSSDHVSCHLKAIPGGWIEI